MAVVTVEAWEGRSTEQKRRLVAAITRAMVEHFGSNAEHLHVIIHEVPRDAWGRDGVLSSDAEQGAGPAGDPTRWGGAHPGVSAIRGPGGASATRGTGP